MIELIKAKEPFRFCTRLSLSELTGLSAKTLNQLCTLIKKVPDSSVYHHTHRFLQQHQYLSPEPPNDFAYWVTEILGENDLGERLASIDTMQFLTIQALREAIIETLETYLREERLSRLKFAHRGDEFHFIKSISFVLPTGYVAYDLREFAYALQKITIDSIYFHVFEARLRLERGGNDFSHWIADSLKDERLAETIDRLDLYTHTLEGLRQTLLKIINKKISS
ncbi:MAG: DUF5752 family protein [Candidatus Omnitrophica bacterium]|nr:DUF5752 family protein [Candidatus Omnitrophota bacterium]